jgi:small Trp-rich protein
MEDVSWWWVTGSFFLTFIWFEVFERVFGFDKKKLHERFDAIQKRRTKRTFEKKR